MERGEGWGVLWGKGLGVWEEKGIFVGRNGTFGSFWDVSVLGSDKYRNDYEQRGTKRNA
jgi:hypothetical protein